MSELLEPAARRYPNAELVSVAISLKRIADILASELVELPLRHGGVAHIRPPQVASVSANGQHHDMAFVQMIGDTGQVGFTITLSVEEVMKRLAK